MKIAIQGHLARGKEVIQILESLGGVNGCQLEGNSEISYYFISRNNNIIHCCDKCYVRYKKYTLEEFEKDFPFKIGDKIKHITSIGIIKEYCYIDNEPAYKVESMELGFTVTIAAKILEPYKEMEIRNITLTLDKAKEWYNKGGELKEIALQAFSEKELNPLPRSWEEFCEKYSKIDDKEYFIDSNSSILQVKAVVSNPCRLQNSDRNICPSVKSAEAHLAMIQLEQLRNCWWNGWEPEYNCSTKYTIKWDKDDLIVATSGRIRAFLIFPTREMAEEFLKCFRDLIEKAGDLI